MKLVAEKFGAAVARAGALGLVVSTLLLAPAPAARAQCVVSPPVSFEPNPPGPGGPRNVALLSPQSMYHLALFQNGPAGPWRILMQETFGYSVLDLTNPASPSVVRWDYMPFDTNSVVPHGDGQSYVQAIGASPDGQRVALSLTGPASPPWNTVIGSPDDKSGFTMWGDTPPVGGVGTAVLQAGARYVHFGLTSDNLYASDVTTLPGVFGPSNVPFEKTSFPGGASLAVAGNYLAYVTTVGTVQIIDASNPGPPGSIATGLPQTSLGASNFFGHALGAVKAAVDPANPRQLWILVELQAISGVENSPSYALMYVTEDTGGNFSLPVSAGPVFRIPSVAGETWGSTGSSATFATHQGVVYVLMWGWRRTPSYQYVLYTTSTAGWGSQTPTTISTPGFTIGDMKTLSSGGNLYGYVASGGNAWVIPMTCQAPNAKATSILTATNVSNGGTTVASGDPVPYGEQLQFTTLVVPQPSLQPLTGWFWKFDFDFHAGAPEDAGAAASPRILNTDADQFGFPTDPPPTVTLVGPCDPRVNGTPATGAGCWASVTTNGGQTASGAPDLTGNEAPAALTPLTVAFEANNKNGSSGPALFTVNWKKPSPRLQNAQILSGGTLTGVSDGHPSASGWKWYFGDTASALALVPGCTTNTCQPQGAAATKGAHLYWITVPYPQIGYTTPDYAGTAALGTYSITDFSPTFSVNGSTTGPLTVVVGQSLNVVNASQHGAGVSASGGYSYSLCQVPTGQQTCADNFVSWPAMADPPSSGNPATSASIPNPGAGDWLLKIRVNYTNPTGTASWPDAGGAGGIAINVTTAVPEIRIFVNGHDPCPPGPGACTPNHFVAKVGDTLKAYSYVNGLPDPSDGSVNIQWEFPSGSPSTGVNQGATYTYGSTGSYDVVLVRNTVRYPFLSAVTVTQPSAPISISASASPNPAASGSTVTFTCSATGGSGNFTYLWGGALNGATSSVVQRPFTNTSQTQSTVYAADCTASDTSTGAARVASASVTILPNVPAGPSCPLVDFSVWRDGVKLVPGSTPFGVAIPMQANAGDVLGFSITAGISPQFDWDFGDGNHKTGPISDGSVTYATHAFTAPALYTVTLKPMFSDNSGFCGGTQYQILVSGPSADFTARYDDDPAFVTTNVTGGKLVRFTAAEPAATSYDWDFGDGAAHGTTQVVTHTFDPGTPTVKLTVVKTGVTASTTLALKVVAPPEAPKWIVPGMAYLAGAIPGSLWQSDVTIFNPDPTRSASIRIAFLDAQNPYAPMALSNPISIQPLGSVGMGNLLRDGFGRPLGSYGSLLVQGDSVPLPPVITARSFNAGDGTKGTFGLSVPSAAAAASGGVVPEASAAASILVGLRQDDAAYTNIGLVNLRGDTARVELDFSDGSDANAPTGNLQVTLAAFQSTQIDQRTLVDGGFTRPSYQVRVRVLQGTAVYPYATVVDRGSTDPIVVTPSKGPSNTYRLPGIVRLNGKNGEKWRSRVTVANPSAQGRTVTMTYWYVKCPSGGACSGRLSITGNVKFAAGQTQSWDDIVATWLTVFGSETPSDTTVYQSSFLDVKPAASDANGDPLVVLGETYNDSPIGHVGLQIPGYTVADSASNALSNRRLALTGFDGDLSTSARFRTNLSLFNANPASTDDLGTWVNVRVYSKQGTLLNTVPVQVGAFTDVPATTLFAGLSGDLSRLSLVVDSIDSGVRVGAYATIIDNTSGDATFVKAQPVP